MYAYIYIRLRQNLIRPLLKPTLACLVGGKPLRLNEGSMAGCPGCVRFNLSGDSVREAIVLNKSVIGRRSELAIGKHYTPKVTTNRARFETTITYNRPAIKRLWPNLTGLNHANWMETGLRSYRSCALHLHNH